jgi:hypothetical protein
VGCRSPDNHQENEGRSDPGATSRMTELVGKPDVLFISTGVDAFIRTDLELLRNHFRVAPLLWKGKSSALSAARCIGRARLVFSWFAGDHSAMAAILACVRGRPSVLVSGGGDVAAMPEIGYGAMSRGHRRGLPSASPRSSSHSQISRRRRYRGRTRRET